MIDYTLSMFSFAPFASDSPLPPQQDAPAWLEGVQKYQHSGYIRPPCMHEVIWQSAQVRCLKIHNNADDNAPIALLVPSLINRHYILDLTKELSLTGYLAKNAHIYILDWSTPEAGDANHDAAYYTTHYLGNVIHHLYHMHQRPLTLIGYCIGGLLALAAALHKKDYVNALALLATPWDFHASAKQKSVYSEAQAQLTNTWCSTMPLMPGAYLSWLFYLTDPQAFERKYQHFSSLHHESSAYARFIAVEHWVNDTVPLTRAFAQECLIDWAQHNKTALLEWHVDNQIIDPSQLTCPIFIAAPQHDRIVPPETSLAIKKHVSNATTLTPDTGHIGMIIGSKRHEELWTALQKWLHTLPH